MGKIVYSTVLNDKEDAKIKEAIAWLKDNKLITATNRYAVTKYALMQLADRVEKYKGNKETVNK